MRKARNALCTDLAEAAVGRKDWGGVLRDKADDVAALVETIDGQLRDPAFVPQVHADRAGRVQDVRARLRNAL